MNIILGKDAADSIGDRYVVLEVDSIRIKDTDQVLQAYCVIETVGIDELALLPALKKRHKDLVHQYRDRQWDQALESAEMLRGHWRGSLDSFYDHVVKRVLEFKTQEPGPDWDPSLLRS